jgi:hypothetical protein
MARIRSLRANVTRDEALEHFSPHGLLGSTYSALFGPLRSIADFYIPFRIFRLEILNRGQTERHILAVDSVMGALMPYVFREPPSCADLVDVETRNHASSLLMEAAARQIATTRSQRMLFSSGFFRMPDLNISAELVSEIHIPYWVGFRGSGEGAKFTVMDAVRRRTEGAKVRQIVRNWLIADGAAR